MPPVIKPVQDPDYSIHRMSWLQRMEPTRANGIDGSGTYNANADTSSWRPFSIPIEPKHWGGHKYRLWFAYTSGKPLTHVRGVPQISGELSLIAKVSEKSKE